jgi:hypothetical protein
MQKSIFVAWCKTSRSPCARAGSRSRGTGRADTGWLHNSTDDLLESVTAVPTLTREGIFNVARRELRYLLEATVKYVYVDQQLASDASVEDRVRFFADNRKVPRSTIRPIDDVTIRMLDDPEPLRNAVKQSFGAPSGYVPSIEEGT